MPRPRVFVDSSVIIAALLSSTGGSFFLLTQCHGAFDFQINEYILAEVQEILRVKFARQPGLMSDLFLLLGVAHVVVLPDPRKAEVRKIAKIISENDAPILASALRSSDYLVTLDNEFFAVPLASAARPTSLRIVKPGTLLKEFKERRAA